MSSTLIGLIGITALFVLIFSRMPIAFIMMLVGFVGFGWIVSFDAALNLAARDLFSVFNRNTAVCSDGTGCLPCRNQYPAV